MQWASAFPFLNFESFTQLESLLERNPLYWHTPSQTALLGPCAWKLDTWLFHGFPPPSIKKKYPAGKRLTGCEFLIANSQDRISCNSNQGHLRWAYACFPPWPTALKDSLCCGLPSPIMWLLWKCPPPSSSLFISSKLFQRRGVTQSKTSFPLTTAC